MVKALLLHGGAGSWRESKVKENAVEAIRNCTLEGWRALNTTNNSVEAVISAVACMEDSGYLNAGVGSVLDLHGGRSLDAGVMSSNGLLGAAAGVRRIRNPIKLARIIAEETPHVLIVGEDADNYGLLRGLPLLPPPPLHVYERYIESLRKLLSHEVKTEYGGKLVEYLVKNSSVKQALKKVADVGDTVGAVAIDDNQVLAAATSTGGVSFKLPGRVGDSPIPGAGFYASNNIACSATGIGEYIIRAMPCLKAHLEYPRFGDAWKTARNVLREVTEAVGSDTMGFVLVDNKGRIAYAYNTEAMLIGYVTENGEIVVDEKPPQYLEKPF
ncbi:isoaspartyl peptidase/L-asparaginase [Thermosphaera chiliense]|uniref:Plant-type L-asparaginase n=1 Tax=Thermosphaera chiliense TaxID=3402707 RepID=A0A7M1UPW0_9CREN|nr:isoaspartyl peptidase/L-asparaginase [Thermosphaera aggregans]QOR94029.1 isoaspartyl peptidase/L-asparaginase [Thermosphaera aggregans]